MTLQWVLYFILRAFFCLPVGFTLTPVHGFPTLGSHTEAYPSSAAGKVPQTNTTVYEFISRPIRHGHGLMHSVRLSFNRGSVKDLLDDNQPDLSDRTRPNRRRRPRKQTWPRQFHISRLMALRKNWCEKETAILQIRARGCEMKEISSAFCYGHCSSVFIPVYDGAGRMSKTFRSCGQCRATKWRMLSIRLNCPGRYPPYKLRQVAAVEECGCVDMCNV